VPSHILKLCSKMSWWSWMPRRLWLLPRPNEYALITAEVRRLHIAAQWAGPKCWRRGHGEPAARTERPVRLGGESTPTVAAFAPAELGCVLRMSDGAAAKLIGDALDLRHRLPLVWAATQTGQVPAYQARDIAKATRHLSAEHAGIVDHRIAPIRWAIRRARKRSGAPQ